MRILLAALTLFSLVAPGPALATTQFPDFLYLDGQKHMLFSHPLEQYYGPHHPRPRFKAPNTATWRGYIATWEIDRDVLYLKSIRAWTEQGEVGLEALFPGQAGRVPATWFTGKLQVPQGKMLKPFVPQPIYEKYLMLTVEQGRVVKRGIRRCS